MFTSTRCNGSHLTIPGDHNQLAGTYPANFKHADAVGRAHWNRTACQDALTRSPLASQFHLEREHQKSTSPKNALDPSNDDLVERLETTSVEIPSLFFDRDRVLGLQMSDVQKLANFDPSGSAALILACARAAWARRRGEENDRVGALLPPESAPSPEFSSPTALASRGRPAMSTLSTSVLSVSPQSRRQNGDRAAAALASGSRKPATTVERRLGGDETEVGPPGLTTDCFGADERSGRDGGERCSNRDCGNDEVGDTDRNKIADGKAGQDSMGVASDSEHARTLSEKGESGGVAKGEHEKTRAGVRRGGSRSRWRKFSALFSGR